MEFRVSMALCALVGLMFLMMGSSEGYYFYVGGEDGWRRNPSENFNHWAERNRFQINDTLVFRYEEGEDSVLLVTKENYYSCKTSNPIEYHSSGSSVIKLGRSGPFFFISGVHGRCEQGQKIIVVVLSPRNNAKATPSPKGSPPSAAVASPSSSSSTSPLSSPAMSPSSYSPTSPSASPTDVSYSASSSTKGSFLLAAMAFWAGLLL